jgi:hypothetical protein
MSVELGEGGALYEQRFCLICYPSPRRPAGTAA